MTKVVKYQGVYEASTSWGPYIGIGAPNVMAQDSMLYDFQDRSEAIGWNHDKMSLGRGLRHGLFRAFSEASVGASFGAQMKDQATLDLWPEVKPFHEDHLAVGKVHKIRYALYGNPKGRPVFSLHGGPGCGCSDADARWFDPDKYLIITHDQRGSGKSLPHVEIKDNTPHDLVEDIEKLRKHLNIKGPIDIFAGSWGTTVALLYAEAYPKNVARMILRGVYTASYEDQDYLYSADGGGLLSPQAWDKFVASLPPGEGRIQERLHRLLEEAGLEGKKEICRLQSEYEFSFFAIPEKDYQAAINNFEESYPEMRINNHYQANRFFLEDGQILANTPAIQHIPMTIIQGMDDPICPPRFSKELHERLLNSRLVQIQGAGHLSSDPGIKQALLKAVKSWR